MTATGANDGDLPRTIEGPEGQVSASSRPGRTQTATEVSQIEPPAPIRFRQGSGLFFAPVFQTIDLDGACRQGETPPLTVGSDRGDLIRRRRAAVSAVVAGCPAGQSFQAAPGRY